VRGRACPAPDHGRLRPWRFVVIRGSGLERLGDVFAKAHAAREPEADGEALERTRVKPLRAPLIVAMMSSPKPSPKVPGWEQVASAAAAAYTVRTRTWTGPPSVGRAGPGGPGAEVLRA
jgi:nitroreductase